MMMKQVVRAALCVCVLGGLLAGPAVAKRITGEKADSFPGVTSDGNLNYSDTTSTTVKLIKYTRSGIIFNRGSAKVTNLSGTRAVFKNINRLVADPEDQNPSFSLLATRDRYTVSNKEGEDRATGRSVTVYNPNKVEVNVSN